MATFIITFPQRDKARRDDWVRVINARDLMRVELGLPTLKSREEIFAEAEKLSK